jgi:putative membrane protein
MIASATMVVPGVSGSMVLMLLGYYESVLALINDAVRALVAMDWAAVGSYVLMLLPFVLGALIGIVLTAKGIRFLLELQPKLTYWGILGLVLSSPFAVLYGYDFLALGIGGWVASLLALAGGLAISLLLGKEE